MHTCLCTMSSTCQFSVQYLYQKTKQSIKINKAASLYETWKTISFHQFNKTCFNVVFIPYPHISYDTKRNHSYIFWHEGEIRNREFSFIKSKRHYARLPETFLNNKSSKQQQLPLKNYMQQRFPIDNHKNNSFWKTFFSGSQGLGIYHFSFLHYNNLSLCKNSSMLNCHSDFNSRENIYNLETILESSFSFIWFT